MWIIQDHSVTIAMLAADSSIFAFTFRYPMSQSASHIYISAVPFSPSESLVSKQYLLQITRHFFVMVGRLS